MGDQLGSKTDECLNWDALPFVADPADPAVATEFTYTPASTEVLRIYWLLIKLTTDANPNPRNMHVEIGGCCFCPVSITNRFLNQTNSRSNYYLLAPKVANSDAVNQSFRSQKIPAGLIVRGTDSYPITTNTSGLMAGDQFSVAWGVKRLYID